MHYPPGVAVLEREQQLVDHRANLLLIEVDSLLILFQVTVDVLEDQVKFALSGYNLLHADDVGVTQLLEEGDLPNCGGGDTLILMVEADLLNGDYLFGDIVSGLVDHSVSTFPYFIDALVSLNLGSS